MARANEVTRTMATTICTVMCVNKETGATYDVECAIARKHDEKKLLKLVEKKLNNNEQKVVYIKKAEVEENLVAMPEDMFFELGEKRPLRGTKVSE